MNQPTIALLGLGSMGSGMGGQLLAKGFSLRVYNRTMEKAEPLRELGAHVASSPAEAAEGAKVILSMLADDGASREVWLSRRGALSSACPGAVLIESGTVTVAWVAELAAHAAGKSCTLLDAPVTGSKTHAARGELLFLVGGPPEAFETVRPVFEAMSRRTVYAGASGSGARLKLINNFLCGVQLASLAEALAWIERSGIDRETALEVLRSGAPGSPFVQMISGRMVARDYATNFRLRLMAKDLRYAQRDASGANLDLRTGDAALRVLDRAIELGWGDDDISSIAEQFRAAAPAGSVPNRSPNGSSGSIGKIGA